MKFKRAILKEPYFFEIREVEVDKLAPNEVLIKNAVCGVCNYDLNYWKGILVEPDGALGHEWCGIVTGVGDCVENLRVGDRVAVMPQWHHTYGYSEYSVLQENWCVKLPDSIALDEALAEPVKCIVTILRAIQPSFGDYGLIFGSGPMGQWCISGLAGNSLAGLIAVDIDDNKLDIALKNGATHVINSKKENVFERIKEITNGHMCDFIVEGTGIPSILNEVMDYAAVNCRARIILMSSHEEVCTEFDFRKMIDSSLQLIVAHPGFETNEQDEYRRTIEMMAKGVFDVKSLITHRHRLEDINEAFRLLENKPDGYVKGIVVCDEQYY